MTYNVYMTCVIYVDINNIFPPRKFLKTIKWTCCSDNWTLTVSCNMHFNTSLGFNSRDSWAWVSRIWLPLTTLQLHITHGLHLPSCTALTHSHPPLHQSHSCHQSLIRLDCLTTPAPHSLTHISSTLPYTRCEVLFCPGWHSECFPCILFPCVYLDCLYTLTVCCLPFDSACLSISSPSAACPDLCIAPVADSVLPAWHLLLPLTPACLT